MNTSRASSSTVHLQFAKLGHQAWTNLPVKELFISSHYHNTTNESHNFKRAAGKPLLSLALYQQERKEEPVFGYTAPGPTDDYLASHK